MSQHPSQLPRPARSVRQYDGINQGMSVLSYLLGGILFYGGLGWVAAHFLHVGVLLPTGIVGGAGLGVYLVVRHYGSPGEQATSAWLEQRDQNQSDWARLAGRPQELCPEQPDSDSARVDSAASGRATRHASDPGHRHRVTVGRLG